MHWIPLAILLHFHFQEKPQIKLLIDEDQIEIFNAIDDFKQYHTNSFRINVFRRVSDKNLELNSFPYVSYIISLLEYSDPKKLSLYEVGNFYEPDVIEVIRLSNSLKFTIEHGSYAKREETILLVTKDGVVIREP